MSTLPQHSPWRRTAAAYTVLAACAALAAADTVVTNFNASAPAIANPRASWFAFGNGLSEAGVHAAGSTGNGAYQAVNWSAASFGAGEVSSVVVDLSAAAAIRVDARQVSILNHTGSGAIRFALDLPGGTEWSTTAQTLSGSYQTFVFEFASMTRTGGAGPLNLAAGKPKFIVARNGQTGTARFEMDEIHAVGSGGAYQLSAVELSAPFDGDAVRAMWLYAFVDNLRVDSAVESQRILDFCATEGVNTLYFGAVNAWAGSSTLRDNLRIFLTTAHASGIRVEALIDGINEYASLAYVEGHLADILAFHDETPGVTADDFDGVHFDMEFWLSSAWQAAANEAQRQIVAKTYLDVVLVGARDYLDTNGVFTLDIGTDLSAHFDGSGMLPSAFLYDGVNQRIGQHVLDHADVVVYMSYIDSASGLLGWTGYELDQAFGEGRTIVLGADIQPVPPEESINTFADNFTPTPYARMSYELERYHTLLSATRAQALAGFSVFHFDGYAGQLPDPRNRADLDGDGDADTADLDALTGWLLSPATAVAGLARDGDLNGDGTADLRDFALFTRCFTGAGIFGPISDECVR